MFLSQRNQLVDLQCKSIDWLLHNKFSYGFNLVSISKINPSNGLECKIGTFVLNEWTLFFPMFPFDPPWKHQITKGFRMFSRGVKKEHWEEKGYWQKQQNATSVFLLLHLNMYRIMLCGFYWWPCLTHFMPLDCFYTSRKY